MDYYTGDVIRKENYVGGKRQYEFLKLYLIPERTREDKAKNEATLALAKAIQSKRIVEIQNDAHGFQNTNKSKVNLLDYLEGIGKQSAERGSGNYARTVLNTCTVPEGYELPASDDFYHPSVMRNTLETFSFLPLTEAEAKLKSMSVPYTDLHSEHVNLEDAFIGLTGKY